MVARSEGYFVYGLAGASAFTLPVPIARRAFEPDFVLWRSAASARGVLPGDQDRGRLIDGSRKLILDRPGVGAFSIAESGVWIFACRSKNASTRVFQDAILSHVLPFALSYVGHLIAHAGTVARDGRALCLLGPSGTGKSTLSVACEKSGFRLLGDDSVRIVPAATGARCAAAYPGARLWPDSAASLAVTAPVPAGSRTTKQRYRPVEQDGAQASTLYPLAALVHLERDPDPAAAIRLTPVPPVEAAALLTAQCFVLDPTDRPRIRRLLALTAATVTVVPVYRLRYPTGFDRLPAVCAHLAELIESSPSR